MRFSSDAQSLAAVWQDLEAATYWQGGAGVVAHMEDLAVSLALDGVAEVLRYPRPADAGDGFWHGTPMRLDACVHPDKPRTLLVRFRHLDRAAVRDGRPRRCPIDHVGPYSHIELKADVRVADARVDRGCRRAASILAIAYRKIEADMLGYLEATQDHQAGTRSVSGLVNAAYAVIRSCLPTAYADRTLLLVMRRKEGVVMTDARTRQRAFAALMQARQRLPESPLYHFAEFFTHSITLPSSLTAYALTNASGRCTRLTRTVQYAAAAPTLVVAEETMMGDVRQTVLPLVCADNRDLIVSAGMPAEIPNRYVADLAAQSGRLDELASRHGKALDVMYRRRSTPRGSPSALERRVAELLGHYTVSAVDTFTRTQA